MLCAVAPSHGQDQPRNVIFILSDDHRYDYMGFHPDGPDFLQTPAMDRIAAEGAHLANGHGQGVYYDPVLNFDGERRKVEGYTTDLLTDYVINWLNMGQEVGGRDKSKPFFLYLSHKAIHAEFEPAPRHKGEYGDAYIPKPQSMKNIERN